FDARTFARTGSSPNVAGNRTSLRWRFRGFAGSFCLSELAGDVLLGLIIRWSQVRILAGPYGFGRALVYSPGGSRRPGQAHDPREDPRRRTRARPARSAGSERGVGARVSSAAGLLPGAR